LILGLVAGFVLATMWMGNDTARAQEDQRTGVEEINTSASEVKLAASSTVWIRGSGFVPETEITLLIADGFGVLSDITITADPRSDGGGSVYPLVANADGSWATEWLIGRFSRAGVGIEGMYTLYAYAGNDLLATAPIALCAPEREEGAEVPSFCSE
jgi:hypothetical protein